MPNCEIINSALILKYNTTSHLKFLSDKKKKYISSGASNNGKKKIRLADINNNKKDIRPADIYKQKPATPNWIP